MPLLLSELREDAQSFADTISKTVNADVLIVDNNYKLVCSTFRHYSSYNHIHENTMLGSVISSRKVVTVEDRRNQDTCESCPERNTCDMVGFVGVPIFTDGFVAGAIALILPERVVPPLFGELRIVVEFVESMARLLADKLRANARIKSLEHAKREREMLIDSIKDAYVVADQLGYITYHNRQFVQLFGTARDCVGLLLKDVLPHSRVAELIDHPTEVRNQLIYYRSGVEAFYGSLACSQIFYDSLHSGMAFRFRPLSQERTNIFYGSQGEPAVSFSWLGGAFFPEQLIHAAKKLAVTSKPIFISGEEGTGKKLLAQCIHNYSNRNDRQMVIIDCNRVYREHLPKSIFGILGKLQSAHESTALFSLVERMPMALQLELVEFLKWPALRHHDGSEMVVDVRFLFTTGADLAALVKQGQFSEELYFRITENHLVIPPLAENPSLLAYQIKTTLDFYKGLYAKPGLEVDKEALQGMLDYHWPGNLLELEAACDALVFNSAGHIAVEDVREYFPEAEITKEIRTISQLEKQMIADLLQSGVSKDKIAHNLGISRATLYRKIKIYEL